MKEKTGVRPGSVPGRVATTLVRALRRARLGPVVDIASVLADRTVRWWRARPGGRGRYLRALASHPLPNLYEVHPEARQATPREIGLRSLDLSSIIGTAVGGPTQRGGDFLPLRPFRSRNWAARWQRILLAIDRLAILPPIDVVRYPPGGPYWVLDGHNRVAAAHHVGQVEVDANVTELVPPGGNPSERPGDLASALAGTRSLRSAGRGARFQTVGDEDVLGLPPSLLDDGRRDQPASTDAPDATPAGPATASAGEVADPPAAAPAPDADRGNPPAAAPAPGPDGDEPSAAAPPPPTGSSGTP